MQNATTELQAGNAVNSAGIALQWGVSVGVLVTVGVFVTVGLFVTVGVFVTVRVGVCVRVFEGVGVWVIVGDGAGVLVAVGGVVAVGSGSGLTGLPGCRAWRNDNACPRTDTVPPNRVSSGNLASSITTTG